MELKGHLTHKQPGQKTASQLTRCEVHIILVITALEGVQGTGDLAGKLLATIHTLPLQMVTQVGNVVLIPGDEVGIN